MTYFIKNVNGIELFKSQYMTIKEALQEAVRSGANLHSANLLGANLLGANLLGADLYSANLRSANLLGANLRHADLLGANLSGANLHSANLHGANLSGANLHSANLLGANLLGANLHGAKNLNEARSNEMAIAQTRILPEGDIIGWKKCFGGVIVKLLIPLAAKRSHAMGRKCRAEFAQVLEVFGAEVGISQHDCKTEYRVGSTIKPDGFDDDWSNECSNGIHFYITRIEAENH